MTAVALAHAVGFILQTKCLTRADGGQQLERLTLQSFVKLHGRTARRGIERVAERIEQLHTATHLIGGNLARVEAAQR